jgi:hypothetical protein
MDNWFESRLEGVVVQVHESHRTVRLHGYQHSPHEKQLTVRHNFPHHPF